MNNYKASSKILFSIVVAVIVVSWSLSAALTNVNIQKAMALAAATTNTAFGLQVHCIQSMISLQIKRCGR